MQLGLKQCASRLPSLWQHVWVTCAEPMQLAIMAAIMEGMTPLSFLPRQVVQVNYLPTYLPTYLHGLDITQAPRHLRPLTLS
jgi:hypothetical protein